MSKEEEIRLQLGGDGDGDGSGTDRDYPIHPLDHTLNHDGGDNNNDDGADAESGSLRPPPRKRRRTVISCTECHRRKQKCDRKLPCTNCISRHRQDGCKYESGAPTAREHQVRDSNNMKSDKDKRPPIDSIPSKVANFGYSRTGASTLGFLQQLETSNPDEPLSHLNPDNAHHGDHFNTRERYRSLIRQLPARTYIDKLVDIYFIEFNWQYQGLDRDVFDKQLAEWYKLPFAQLTTGGPQALQPNLRAFPAMLFQVLAIALLLLHPGSDSAFESLKYAGNMSFEDLAVDYSESGMAILSLLGKRQMTITTVLTGFLRASFLKYVALVTESWHAIGSAIRDGQEIGLHRDSLDPKPLNNTAEAILENQWEIQRRRKLWVTLIWWDIHTAVVLGRPTTIDHSTTHPTLPIDAVMNILPSSSSSSSKTTTTTTTTTTKSPPSTPTPTPLIPRTDTDPPTPLTRLLFAITLGSQLRSVLTLEKETGPHPHSFARIDALHTQFLSIEPSTPAWLRLENPDTRFDHLPECYWLPYARAQMPQMLAFNLMALHRPYIFTRRASRTQALRASLGMLQAQRYHFSTLRAQQYKMFSLFFGTFDAVVLVAAVFILFKPGERWDGDGDGEGEGRGDRYVRSAVLHFRWAMERFEVMSERNALARAALGVLKAVEVRLMRSLGVGKGEVERFLEGLGGEGKGKRGVIKVVTNAGLMPLPWADGDGPTGSDGDGDGDGVGGEGGTFGTGPGMSPGSAAAMSHNLILGSSNTDDLASSVSPQVSLEANIANFTPSTTSNPTTSTNSGPSPSSSTPSSTSNNTTSTTHDNNTARSWSYPTSTTSLPGGDTNNFGTNNNNMLFNSSDTTTTTTTAPWNELNLPSNFDWASVQPIYAVGDLLYNDLQLVGGFGTGMSGGDEAGEGGGIWPGGGQTNNDLDMLGGGGGGVGNGNEDGGVSNGGEQQQNNGTNNNNINGWLFEGDFGNDSVWNLLNQFGPFQ